MRRILVPTSVLLLGLMAGCSTAPTPATETKAPETKTAETPAAPTETAPAAAAPAAATPTAPANAALTTDDQKTVYAIGLVMNGQISSLALSDAELDVVRRALGDAAAGKPAVDLEVWGPKIDAFAKGRANAGTTREKAKGAEFASKAAAEKGAQKLPSGLVFRELKAGTGANPKATDNVKVHYRGTLIDGKEFDSSFKRNEPASFPLSNVIPCWTEGVQKLKVGGKAQLVCPSDIAYGDNGRPPSIPGGATLVFEVELLGINN